MKKEKIEPFIRINSRITKEQHAFLKAYAKKHKKTEGEIHRFIISSFIKNEK